MNGRLQGFLTLGDFRWWKLTYMSAAAGSTTARPSVSMSRDRLLPLQNFVLFDVIPTSPGPYRIRKHSLEHVKLC